MFILPTPTSAKPAPKLTPSWSLSPNTQQVDDDNDDDGRNGDNANDYPWIPT